jgi:flagellar hook-basal body complex protein FliE
MNLLGLGQVSGDRFSLARTNELHYTADGRSGRAAAEAEGGKASFERAMLEALDGVSASQSTVDDLVRLQMTDPDMVEAHQITTAMAEANLSLNIARTVLDRITRGWKELINTR